MRTQGGSPNLINGVSRQPPEVRLTSQLEESINQFPTISRGLVPRNPALFQGAIPGSLPVGALTHLIDRDASERYVVTISPAGVEVHTLSGVKQTVNAPDGWGYLSGASADDYRALTVQDHTFILNRKKVVAKAAAKSPTRLPEALVHIAQGDYSVDYKVWVNGSLVASYTTETGSHSNSNDALMAAEGIQPQVIAYTMVNGSKPTDSSARPQTIATFMRNALPDTEWNISLFGPVIHIQNKLGKDFGITVEAGTDYRLRVHKQESAEYSELPRKAPNGFMLKISGSEDTNYDDYYVRFNKETGTGQGAWKETLAPDAQFKMDPATMPHLLVREADGTFTFKRGPWEDREVGDEDTNPWPSFVGKAINGIAFGNSRLGFYSGEALSQSRHNSFFNFWVESILAPLDTDPVDAAISYPEVSTIHNVVPFSGEVILFTESVPFRLGKGDTLTQKTVSYEHLLSNTVSRRVCPVAAGSHLYFVNDTPSGSFVHEFSYDRAVDNMTAECITEHVAGYIPQGVVEMVADGDLKTLALRSERDPTAIYVYKWLRVGNEKPQSAWQKWTVDSPIVAMRFYDEALIVVTNRGDTREVLAINCHEAWTQNSRSPVYLDRQVHRTGQYDPATQLTSYAAPYDCTDAEVVLVGSRFGVMPTIHSRIGNVVKVVGDYGGLGAKVGFNYDSYGVLSPLLTRPTNNTGGYGNALPGMVTTVANLRFGTGDTASLRVELMRDYRKTVTYDFSAALVGTKTSKLGSLVVGAVDKNVSIMARSEDFRLRFGKIGPFPYSILSYAWSGDARPLSY